MTDNDLSEKDKAIIRYVHQYRLLKSQDHIQRLVGGSYRTVRRLTTLAEASYLHHFKSKDPSKQRAYGIGNRGITFLAKELGLRRPRVNARASNNRLKGINFEHTFLIAKTMIAIELATKTHPEVRFITPDEIYNRALTPEAAKRWFQKERFYGREKRFKVTARIEPPGYKPDDATIYGDWIFGLEYGKPDERWQSYFILEADRGGMPVETTDFARTSIIKKMYVYLACGRKRTVVMGRETKKPPTIFFETFGIPNIQTLFVVDPVDGHEGEKRIPNCITLAKKLTEGKGTRQFLFAGPTWSESEDLFSAQLLDGTGSPVTIVPLQSVP